MALGDHPLTNLNILETISDDGVWCTSWIIGGSTIIATEKTRREKSSERDEALLVSFLFFQYSTLIFINNNNTTKGDVEVFNARSLDAMLVRLHVWATIHCVRQSHDNRADSEFVKRIISDGLQTWTSPCVSSERYGHVFSSKQVAYYNTSFLHFLSVFICYSTGRFIVYAHKLFRNGKTWYATDALSIIFQCSRWTCS